MAVFRLSDGGTRMAVNAIQNVLHIWRLVDGRRGHENQSAALVAALQEQIAVTEMTLPVASWRRRVRDIQQQTAFHAQSSLQPDLILAVGHKTHWPMLRLQRRFGGKTVVLMKPSLPYWCFDFCLVPEHDLTRTTQLPPNVATTLGALCHLPTTSVMQADQGLIILGGPNRHHHWSNLDVAEQVHTILRAQPHIKWQVATSPRTPTQIEASLELPAAVPLRPWQKFDADWLKQQMVQAGQIWVSSDSASMLSEAVATFARVGVIDLPVKSAENKLVRFVDSLLARGLLHTYSMACENGCDLPFPAAGFAPLAEHRRCAALVLKALGLAEL